MCMLTSCILKNFETLWKKCFVWDDRWAVEDDSILKYTNFNSNNTDSFNEVCCVIKPNVKK